MANRIVVFLKGSKRAHEYTGSMDAALTPANALIINEMIPDIGNRNGGKPIPKIRSIYNSRHWTQVILDGEQDAPEVDDEDDDEED